MGKSIKAGGLWFWDVLFIVFLVLKLAGVIDWSWWWVTAPIWGQFVVAGLVVFAVWWFFEKC